MGRAGRDGLWDPHEAWVVVVGAAAVVLLQC